MTGSELSDRVAFVNTAIAMHQGHIRLESVDDGTATVSFHGLCKHCPMRPLTLNGIIRPALNGVAGISHVEAVGVRTSDEAERRMAQLRDDPKSIGAQYLSLLGDAARDDPDESRS